MKKDRKGLNKNGNKLRKQKGSFRYADLCRRIQVSLRPFETDRKLSPDHHVIDHFCYSQIIF